MAPNTRTAKALGAMRDLGIPEEKTKPVLQRLLKLYKRKWEFIEGENYRALVDLIFDEDEAQVKEYEADEPESPLKRLCIEYKDNYSLSPGENHTHWTRSKGKQALQIQEPSKECQKGYRSNVKGKRKGKTTLTVETGLAEYEEITDDMVQMILPVSVIYPDLSDREAPSREENTVRGGAVCPEPVNVGDVKNHEDKVLNEKAANLVDDPCTDLEIAASSSGEVKIYLSCNSAMGRSDFHMPSFDAVLKMVEDKLLRSYNIVDPSFSLKNIMSDMCDCFLEQGTESDNYVVEAFGLSKHSDTVGENKENGSENYKSNHQKDNMSSPHDYDIAKGHERAVITLVNEVNNECPPSFSYIPQNIVFKRANVSFSLPRHGDDKTACSGNCLSASVPCACGPGGHCAYTIEGLVKEDFLNECISMNRDPQKNCPQCYCKECPLERFKNEKILEPCKGHSIREFIKECWRKCGCSKKCGNQVVQRGITINLQVFMTPESRGWGLRTLQDLPKGAFVCEYVGEILTNEEFYKRVSARANSEEAHAYHVLLDADWSCAAKRILKDEKALCLDSSRYGNISRFINHRCFDPSLVGIPVEVETPNHTYYHLAFFTTREVKAFEELTWDYGIDFDDHEDPTIKAFKCECGSKYCRNIRRKRSKLFL
ncbi:probable inactive histone-lysine N-methyltransferase SUVR1 [Impatiens glandulifera]|uniref:probable inactive histone-lysine N-methyltransferase SUVR1 n=1 Tax=Impatiens glandulifera TaxID=253017 RepID=UPI001FB0D803|nr:probable inactive histone-lysine N-methyltransferase SUVR1 [Impatiens glandulifera]